MSARGDFSTCTATLPPGATPRSRIRFAQRADSASTSAQVQTAPVGVSRQVAERLVGKCASKSV